MSEEKNVSTETKELSASDILLMKEQIIKTIETCYDPEIPVNIYELGLIYDVAVTPQGSVAIKMTLTSPACPSAQDLPVEVARKVKGVPGVEGVTVDVVFDPPWSPAKMSEAARLTLGIDY
jgi:FeS assembly SUF system protein